MRRAIGIGLAALLLAAGGAHAAASRKGAREIDKLFSRPDLATIRLTSVAMLPAASFDNIGPAERQAEGELMKAIRDAGFRWITAPTAREMLRRDGGDSLLKAIREEILAHDPIDSTRVPRVCGRLRVNGLITVRVDQAEQISIQTDQTGKPSTTIQVRAVLMDSLGRKLWSASGSYFIEGPYMQAAQGGGIASAGGSIATSAIETRNNAPDWPLAMSPLFARWAPTFPRLRSMLGGAPPDSSAH